jgi:diacylglycerol kinase family enzyme
VRGSFCVEEQDRADPSCGQGGGPASSGCGHPYETDRYTAGRRYGPAVPPIATPAAAPEALALEAPARRRRMLVIVNPYATTVSEGLRHLVVYALQGRYEVDAVDTQGRDHATLLCREAAQEGYDVVVAFGGDGTVNEAANGLAGAATPLSCLPGGATNVFCRMLGMPNDIVDATEHLLRLADDFRPRRVDLPHVNGRAFTFSAGVGLDAAVVERVEEHPRLKARFRQWYWAGAAVGTFTSQYLVRPPQLEIEVAGETVRGVTVIVQNGDPYTYFSRRPIRVADGARLDDGTLGAVVLKRARPLDLATVGARLLLDGPRVVDHRHVAAFPGVDGLVVRSADGRPVPIEVDGDFIGAADEAVFGVVPGGLGVVA